MPAHLVFVSCAALLTKSSDFVGLARIQRIIALVFVAAAACFPHGHGCSISKTCQPIGWVPVMFGNHPG